MIGNRSRVLVPGADSLVRVAGIFTMSELSTKIQ